MTLKQIKPSNYALANGSSGRRRLELLNEICNPLSLSLFDEKVDDLHGKRVLEIGCGIGLMTAELAKRVGIGGEVVAIDASVDQLAIAKEAARAQSLDNIRFKHMQAEALDRDFGQFDLIYCRFLLAHLSQSDVDYIVKTLLACLKVGGHIVMEEPTSYEKIACNQRPEPQVFKQWKSFHLLQPKVFDTDLYVGERLASLVAVQEQVVVEEYKKVRPWFNKAQAVEFMPLAVLGLKDGYIKRSLVSEEEINGLLVELTNVNSIDFQISFCEYAQVIARKY